VRVSDNFQDLLVASRCSFGQSLLQLGWKRNREYRCFFDEGRGVEVDRQTRAGFTGEDL
jgi:hypothetical protein